MLTDIKHMAKSFEVITEAIHNPKHPFRKAHNRPRKSQKSRYERRKIREYMHLGHWDSDFLATEI